MQVVWMDFETGGLDAKKHSALSFAAVITDGGKEVASLELNIRNDEMVVCPAALAVNKIDLREPGLTNQKFREEFQLFLGEHLFGGCEVTPVYDDRSWIASGTVKYNKIKFKRPPQRGQFPIIGGHNVGFDLSFLKELMSPLPTYTSYHSVDTMVMAAGLRACGLLPSGMGLSLTNLVNYFELPVAQESLHNAMNDIRATMTVWEKMLLLIKGKQHEHQIESTVQQTEAAQ